MAMTLPDLPEPLELKLIELAQHGTARCGLGFGKFPLGLMHALKELQPLANTKAVNAAIAAFQQRLDE